MPTPEQLSLNSRDGLYKTWIVRLDQSGFWQEKDAGIEVFETEAGGK
jgi:hypothetical protein